jgi:hypothetical protein
MSQKKTNLRDWDQPPTKGEGAPHSTLLALDLQRSSSPTCSGWTSPVDCMSALQSLDLEW